MTELARQTIDGLMVITPSRFEDARGFFMETYSAPRLAEAGYAGVFVQDNHALSTRVGTVRGLHFQAPPDAQDKLVRVVRGSILDVAVDLRRSSRTYGKHLAVELSANNGKQALIPAGFAHGYQTLEPDTEVVYKVTAIYAPKSEAGLLWNDPALAIGWPIGVDQATVSARDAAWPALAALTSPF